MKHSRHEQAGLQSKLENPERKQSLHLFELERAQMIFNTTMEENYLIQSKYNSLSNDLELVRAQHDADYVEFEALRAQFSRVLSQRDNANEDPTLLGAQHSNTLEELVSVMALFE